MSQNYQWSQAVELNTEEKCQLAIIWYWKEKSIKWKKSR